MFQIQYDLCMVRSALGRSVYGIISKYRLPYLIPIGIKKVKLLTMNFVCFRTKLVEQNYLTNKQTKLICNINLVIPLS